MSSPLEELRIPLQEIISATHKFSVKRIIDSGGFGYVYKGKLSRHGKLIDVDIKRLDRKFGQGDTEFWTEIAMLSNLKHINIVSIVGFCDEADEKIIITKLEVNGSLGNNLRNPNLTWLQRLRICIGVARALTYIHCDTSHGYDVIHRDIKSGKVMLDENWDAKVSGFGLSVKVPATRRHHRVFDKAVGTLGYADPVYVETQTATQKSDVYSFGVVLFEVLSGRRAYAKDGAGRYLASVAMSHYEEGKLDEIIDPHIRNQMHPLSFKIFSDTAYHCLKKDREQRPDMDKVAEALENAWELQWKHENPAQLTPPAFGTSPNHLQIQEQDQVANGKVTRHAAELKDLRIPLTDIIKATKNFDKQYRIGKGGQGKVYEAKLDVLIETKNKGEVSKKQNRAVAIKWIKANGEEGFDAEIKLLTRCKHDNIVTLHGFCDESDKLILVYEHVSNGSLDDHLRDNHKLTNLTWRRRLNICIGIARGLKYLHTTKTEDKQSIVHRDIKSGNILLTKNWGAKIADFGLSKFHHVDEQEKTHISNNVAGTPYYVCPAYLKNGKFKRAIDIYSFGVVFFEILSGKLAYDKIYIREHKDGIAHIARQRFNDQTLHEMVDPIIMKEVDQDCLKTFLAVAHKCVSKTQKERPSAEQTLEELEKALLLQANKDRVALQMSFKEIQLATQDFAHENIIGKGRFGKVYKGEVTHANKHHVIAAKRLNRKLGQGDAEFLKELEILLEYKNDNVIGLVGYCDEFGEKIIVYEYAAHKSLDLHLSSAYLTWTKRLQICIDVAIGLDFLHGGLVTQDVVIHRDIKSANILLTAGAKAKITDFGLSLISPISQEMDYVIDSGMGTRGYADPFYLQTSILTKESDMYSFGVVLFEILCGRLVYENHKDAYLIKLVKKHMYEGNLWDIVFVDIKEQIVPDSLTTYSRIAFQCLSPDREDRPTTGEVVLQLKQALELQLDHEIWEPKLPRDYKEIIRMSKSHDLAISKKDLYDILCKGILLRDEEVWFWLGSNDKKNGMISARKFAYSNHSPHMWQSLSESRFLEVAEMLDISNLMINIKTTTKYLSPSVAYGVYLVFKFCNLKEVSSKAVYVNMKYRMGSETFHAYFATSRDKDWMMIELDRFLNQTEEVVFEVLLENLSPYVVDDIYVEGIEFRAIDNEEHKEIEMSNGVQQVLNPNLKNVDQVLPLSEMNGKKHLMLSAREALYNISDLTLYKHYYKTWDFTWLKKAFYSALWSAESGFPEVVELLPQQVFLIKCAIKPQMLSPDTTYGCYLVFKLSEECQGFHCPVEVRDLLNRGNKEAEIVYFKTPSPWNIHDNISQVPKQREDGCMELNVWKTNSDNAPTNDLLQVNLKLRSYKGTMSGLIVYGLEFRPM
uniref:uncharacterized protein LOC122606497 isoform X2 n=1 Tax=Erigeron canadensis TaxID=72917 RepID=UPI001CB8B9C6|nr:uncharacterized protein LOC122606497 isoform X2 [Erigeron canadensis]